MMTAKPLRSVSECSSSGMISAGASAAAAANLTIPKTRVAAESSSPKPCLPRKPTEEPFPVKLYRMLEEAASSNDATIGWSPCGTKFLIFQPKVFAKTWMVRYFKQSKYKSFQRQLNLYNFHRQSRGKIKGVYSHHLFVRGNLANVVKMKRMRGSTLSAAAVAAAKGLLDDSSSTGSGRVMEVTQAATRFLAQEFQQQAATVSPLQQNNSFGHLQAAARQQQNGGQLPFFQADALQDQQQPNLAQYLPLNSINLSPKPIADPTVTGGIFDTAMLKGKNVPVHSVDTTVVPQGFFNITEPASRITPSSSSLALFVSSEDDDADSIGTIDQKDLQDDLLALDGLWQFHLQSTQGQQPLSQERRFSISKPFAV